MKQDTTLVVKTYSFSWIDTKVACWWSSVKLSHGAAKLDGWQTGKTLNNLSDSLSSLLLWPTLQSSSDILRVKIRAETATFSLSCCRRKNGGNHSWFHIFISAPLSCLYSTKYAGRSNTEFVPLPFAYLELLSAHSLLPPRHFCFEWIGVEHVGFPTWMVQKWEAMGWELDKLREVEVDAFPSSLLVHGRQMGFQAIGPISPFWAHS